MNLKNDNTNGYNQNGGYNLNGNYSNGYNANNNFNAGNGYNMSGNYGAVNGYNTNNNYYQSAGNQNNGFNNYNNYNNNLNNNYSANQNLFNGMSNAYMANNNGSYQQVQNAYANAERISDQKFNLILGGCLLWGFLINCILCTVFSDSIIALALNNYAVFLISYFVLVIVGSVMVNKSDNPVVSFLGYNLIVIPIGMIISMSLSVYVAAGYSSIIPTAFGITAVVTLTMMVLSSAFPDFFASNTLGKILGITLIVTIIIELLLWITGAASLGIIDYIVVLLFCGYIGYDWAKANMGEKTVDKAVDAAAMLYVDIANLFLRIMRILARAQR